MINTNCLYKLILILILFTTFNLYAQKIELYSLNAGGDVIVQNSKTRMSFTIGDPFIKTVKQKSNTLTQGFQQPLSALSTKLEAVKSTLVGIKVFPNPTENTTRIVFKEPITDKIYMTVVSANGNILKKMTLTKGTSEYALILDFPSGEYNVILSSASNNSNTFKILKL